MPLAPGLAIRTLVRPGGRTTIVVVRRPRKPRTVAPAAGAERRALLSRTEENADRSASVPGPAAQDRGQAAGRFSRPVERALAALGGRACPIGSDGVALDGRRAPLVRLVAEANRCLLAAGRLPIAYPGVRSRRDR